MPFAAIAVVFAAQGLLSADPVLAFPFYLVIVLLASLRQQRAQAIAVSAVAAMASLVWPLLAPSQLIPAVLLALVLLVVAVATSAVTSSSREAASAAQHTLDELEANDRRLRAMLESSDVGLALAGLDGAWLLVNERFAEILGRSRDELIRTTLAEVTSEADRSSVNEALAMLRNGDVMRWEADIRQLRPDASVVQVAVFMALLPVPEVGEPCVLVQAIDVSRRVHADALLDCIAATRQVMATATSAEVAVPQLLQAYCGYLGWSAAQFWASNQEGSGMTVRHAWNAIGTTLEGFLQASRDSVVAPGAGLVGRVWKSGVLAAEADLARAADNERLTSARAAGLQTVLALPVVDAGEVTGVIELASQRARGLHDDEVTMLAASGVEIGQFIRRSETAQALRRSEADHRAIYERSPIGIARISSDGDLMEANPALLHMLEHNQETMRTTAWPDLLRAYDQAAARLRKASFLAGVNDGSSVQVRAATGAGIWLWLQLTATAIPDTSGRPEHVLVLVEDVTAVRETSDKLTEALEAQRQANANLEKIDRTKSEFLSIVSHEFRTALTGIQGFSELIRDGGLEPDEVRAYGGYIFNDAERVNRLIGDMLDLDRMESGRMAMRTMDVDINDILMEAISRAAPSAVTVEFRSDLDPRLPIVAGDRDRLIQVVGNLVNNAVKYSPEGGTITLSSRVDGRFALVSVTDTGIGIPQEEIGHVFERFRRVRSGAAQSIPGTGLGLTIVKQIVELHGGKIWVESAVGHGSSFHFTIPLAPEGAKALQLRHG
ncbi:MAG TPA: ATP-binding protein [Candidatus Dormibacteraeota bacterium]|nr:ATP-binding protein [Candidatus Dormibacteraeota bacterium]